MYVTTFRRVDTSHTLYGQFAKYYRGINVATQLELALYYVHFCLPNHNLFKIAANKSFPVDCDLNS